ncbi:retrotransposon protein, putative, ty1-copia subclass [Tanacetum coccineum]
MGYARTRSICPNTKISYHLRRINPATTLCHNVVSWVTGEGMVCVSHELMKKKKFFPELALSGILTIETLLIPSKILDFDMVVVTIFVLLLGFTGKRTLKPGAFELSWRLHGIIAHRTPPYMPQNNGVSERRNRTLLHMVRSMMSQILTKSFWVYALETAALILNARGSVEDLEVIQEEDTNPAVDTSLNQREVDKKLINSSESIPFVDAYGSESKKWLDAMTGYVFVLNGGAVDRKSTKQSIFATSSTDAEYIAAFDASKEAVWIRKFISGLGIVPTIEEPISMYCDNTGAIAIAKDDGVTKGARHFRAKVHYLRETIKMGDVKIEKIDIDDNLADPFIKALAFPKHFE